MIVAATGEDEEAGSVTVIRGGRRGYATTGNSSFDQDSQKVPGEAGPEREFGSTLAVLQPHRRPAGPTSRSPRAASRPRTRG